MPRIHSLTHTFHPPLLHGSPTHFPSKTAVSPIFRITIDKLFAGNSAQNATVLALVAPVQNLQHSLPHLSRLLASIQALPDAILPIVVYYRSGLLMIGAKSLLERIGIVIASLHKSFASNIILHMFLGRVEGSVVGTTRGGVNETSSNTSNKKRVINLKLNGMLQGLFALREHLVKTLSLGYGSGEAIQDETSKMLVETCLPEI